MKKNNYVGLFEDRDGVISMPKVQAFLFTIALVVMLMVDTFMTEKDVSWESYLVAAAGAGVGIAGDIADKKLAKFKINENKKPTA